MFGRCALERSPSLSELAAVVDAAGRGFVLTGRWGLPEGAPPGDRVVVAGVDPACSLRPGDDPFAALDGVAPLGAGAPAGAIGGGFFGWLGFDVGRRIEPTLGPQPQRPVPVPAAQLAWYDDVLRRDEHGIWWVEALLPLDAPDGALEAIAARWRRRLDEAPATALAGALGPMQIVGSGAAHRRAVAETIERIRAGELFQANVCLRLEGTLQGSPAALVEAVLEHTDPWYGGWITDGAGHAILSASPELFLRRRARAVTTGPIKGTLPRAPGASTDPREDPVAAALLASAKDRAEHVMIVDLMRNDLGRVCDYGSIRADLEPTAEPHAGVWHLVSEVSGRLHEGFGDGRLVRATFPPGSVTGAPKVQAMRVIAAVEGTGREAYTGAHGLLSPVCGLDLGVTIRTLEIAGERAWIGVGGGIVADSDPQAELDEALAKASAVLAAAGSHIRDADGDDATAPVVASGVPWSASPWPRPDVDAGLLETIAVSGRRPIRVDRHLARLAASADELGIAVPADLSARIARALESGPPDGRLRIALDFASAVVEVVAFSETDPEGVMLAPLVVPGGLGPHKWLDRRLIDAARAALGATPLLLDATGEALEAGWANLWWEGASGALCTPPADGRILPGITRGALLAAAPERCSVSAPPPLSDLARRPLLLSSARGLTPARMPGTPDAVARRAAELAAELGAVL
jgi:para-aminobenzoate synthetase / 4-amino-4-deoxychorismate lyase